MIVRNRWRFPSGQFVKRPIFLGGLAVGAFIVTLAFSSWHEGLWHAAAEPPTGAVPQPNRDVVASGPAAPPAGQSSEAASPTPPGAVAPATAVNPPAAIAPLEAPQGDPQYEQSPNPGVDSEAMRRDRGVQHSSGSH